jgi:hypothetical protein
MEYEQVSTGIRQFADDAPGDDWYAVIWQDLTPFTAHNSRMIDDDFMTVTYGAGYIDLDSAQQLALEMATAQRYAAEVGGLAWVQPSTGNLVLLATDRDSQGKIAGAYNKAAVNSNFSISSWKCATPQMQIQFIALTHADILSMGDAVAAHVGAVFDVEAARFAAINAATDVATIAALFN